MKIPMANHNQNNSGNGYTFSSQVDHFRVNNAGKQSTGQRVSNWPIAPSMAKAANANAKQEQNLMKRARSFSNNRGYHNANVAASQNSNT